MLGVGRFPAFPIRLNFGVGLVRRGVLGKFERVNKYDWLHYRSLQREKSELCLEERSCLIPNVLGFLEPFCLSLLL